MNREVTEAIEFLQWLLEGLIKFFPDHPLFSRIDVVKVAKGEDKWVGEDARGILDLARRSLGLSESTPLDQTITRLQSLVENPSTVSSLPEPVLARLREEEQELVSRDSPQEKRGKLETISKRPPRARYEPRVPSQTGPSPKAPSPPTTKGPAEVVGFVDIQAPADIATLRGATEKAFIDEVVQTLRRERPEIEEGTNLEQLRKTATEVVRHMEAEGKGGASYKINATAFSRALTDRGRLAEVLVSVPTVAETPTPPAEKKAVHLAPEAPIPTPTPEVQQRVTELVSQIKTNKETFVRDLGQKIEESHPEFSKQQAGEVAERIATRLERYEPGKVSEEAAFASIALNPELFERVFPEPEVRVKVLDEAVKVSSKRQQEEQIAKQVLPTLIPEAGEAVVDTVYQPTKQRFVPTPEEAPGPVYFEPQTIIERVEKAPQTGFELTGTIKPSIMVSQPPAKTASQKTLEFLSPSSAVPEKDYKSSLTAYLETQISSRPPEELAGLTKEQIEEGASRAADLIVENTPAEIRTSFTPTPITLDVLKLIESFHQPSDAQGKAIASSFEVSTAPPPKENIIQVPFSPSSKPTKEATEKLTSEIADQIKSLPPEARIDPQSKRELTPTEIEGASAALAAQTIAKVGPAVGATSAPVLIKIETSAILEAAAKPAEELQSQVSRSFELVQLPSSAPTFPTAATQPPTTAAVEIFVSPAGKTPEQIKTEISGQLQEKLTQIPPVAGVSLTEEQIRVVTPIFTEETISKIQPGSAEPIVVRIDTSSLETVASGSGEEIVNEAPKIISVVPATAVVFGAGAAKEQLFVGVAEKFAPDVGPEVRVRVESLARSAAANPEKFQSQLKEKLITSSEFASQFTSPEQIAVAADGYSKDLTERLISLDKGTFGGPSLAEIASSTEVLDKTFASPIDKQSFVSSVSEKGVQVGQMAPVMASALGVEEGVLKAAYQPRSLTISDSPQEGLSTIATKNLLPAAEGKIPFSEAIILSTATVSVDGKLPWAKADGPAQELGIKISYAAAPEALPPKISDLLTTVQKEGFAFNQQSPQDALPLFVFTSGVSSSQFQALIDQAQEKGVGQETVSHLDEFLLRLKALEETRPALFAEIQRAYPAGSVQVSFIEYAETPGVFAFVPSEGTYALGTPAFAGPFQFDPGGIGGSLASKALDKITAPAKKKISESLAKTAAGKAVKAGAIKIAAKVGLSQGLSNITAAIGTAIGGPLGALIGKVIGWLAINVLGKIASFFKKHSKKIIGAGLAVLGLFLGGWAGLGLMAVGGGIALGALAGVGAPGIGVAALFSTFVGFATIVLLPVLVVPVVFVLLSIPITVALILFIINSGAYLVPPNPASFSAISNPYIDISKTADRTEFDNSELPETVTYTIEIVARRGSLTNIRFQTECRVIRAGAAPSCPPVSNVTVNGQPVGGFPPTAPGIISPADDPYTITYQQTFSGNSFYDALVSDTFTIIADVPEQQDTQAAASAGVRIGNPPDECPNGWPILPYASEGSLLIIQGPRGLYTHTRVEAIDVTASVGHPLTATHTGIATAGPGGVYGTSIRINSSCGGRPFSTIYGHLTTINIGPGETVVMGQSIGTSGITGTDNAHLHYEFSPSTSGIPMAPPYIPKSVPYGCYYGDACGVTIP